MSYFLTYVDLDEHGRPYVIESADHVRIEADNEQEARAIYRRRLGINRLPKDVFVSSSNPIADNARANRESIRRDFTPSQLASNGLCALDLM